MTEDEFNRVQKLLGKKGRPTRVNRLDFAFRGPIKCGECGCAVTAEHKLAVFVATASSSSRVRSRLNVQSVRLIFLK